MWAEEDTFLNVNHGPITPEHLQEFLTLIQDIRQRHGYVFVITDVGGLTSVSAETRRLCAEWARANTVAASAVLGASVATRAIIALISRAMAIIGPSGFTIKFFDHADSARVWLAEQRRLIRAP